MKEKLVDKLLEYLINEDERLENLDIPSNYIEKRNLLRGIINIRSPRPTSDDILKLEDQLLQLELQEKKVTDVSEFEAKENCIALWQGDITTLKIDAIVNPGNSALLGCFIPNHSCLDNQIHTSAGTRLRLACNDIMKGKEEETGKAEITEAYNLPCNYVIHTVGPMITDKVTEKEKQELASCYKSCLDLAKEKNIKIIAFPTVSTGVFHFPQDLASQIAVSTVRKYIKENPNTFDKIIFDVYSEEDWNYYDRLF